MRTATSAAQTGIRDGLDDFLGGHFLQHLSECEITVHGDVFFDVFRVDHAAVPECDTFLLLVESGFGEGSGFGFVVCVCGLRAFVVDKAFHDTALEKMFLNDFRDVVYGDAAVEGAFRVYDHDGTECAETEAAGHDDFDFFVQTLCLQFIRQLVVQSSTAGRGTASTAADKYVRTDHNI